MVFVHHHISEYKWKISHCYKVHINVHTNTIIFHPSDKNIEPFIPLSLAILAYR
jgi:hypothetical protein